MKIKDAVKFSNLQEQHIYGSARLGVVKQDLEMIGAVDPSDVGEFDRVRGMKRYELTNHLGNVLTVISDRKMATVDNGVNVYYHAEIISYSDYYPFGAPMSQGTTDRTWSVEEYRFGFNGMEIEGGHLLFTTNRVLNSSLGRWFSVDPIFKAFISPFNSMSNSPIQKIDPKGDDDYFDSDGLFLFSTGHGSGIRIMSDQDLKFWYSKECSDKLIQLNSIRYSDGGEKAYQKALTEFVNSKMTVTLNNFSADVDDNWRGAERADRMVENIQTHYGLILNIDFKAGGIARESVEKSIMRTNSTDGIRVGFDEYSGKPSSYHMGDLNNFKNNLIHEYYHWINHKGVDVELPNEYAAKEHLKAYSAQIKDKTWESTTPQFKDAIIRNIGTYLDLIKSSKQQEQYFEKLLGVDYKKLSHDSDKVQYSKK